MLVQRLVVPFTLVAILTALPAAHGSASASQDGRGRTFMSRSEPKSLARQRGFLGLKLRHLVFGTVALALASPVVNVLPTDKGGSVCEAEWVRTGKERSTDYRGPVVLSSKHFRGLGALALDSKNSKSKAWGDAFRPSVVSRDEVSFGAFGGSCAGLDDNVYDRVQQAASRLGSRASSKFDQLKEKFTP